MSYFTKMASEVHPWMIWLSICPFPKKTIYQYFKDKDELVLAVSDLHISIEKKEFKEITKDSKNAIDELFRVGQWLKDSFRDMNPAVLYDIQKYHQAAWRIWLQYKK